MAYDLSARYLQLAIKDLANAWKNFFDKSQPDWGKPKFKSKKAPRQGFKTDRAKIINGKLRLDKPINISKDNWFDLASYAALKINQVKVISIFKENETYYAALSYEEEVTAKTKTHQKLQLMLMSVISTIQRVKSMSCQPNCKSSISELSIIKEC